MSSHLISEVSRDCENIVTISRTFQAVRLLDPDISFAEIELQLWLQIPKVIGARVELDLVVSIPRQTLAQCEQLMRDYGLAMESVWYEGCHVDLIKRNNKRMATFVAALLRAVRTPGAEPIRVEGFELNNVATNDNVLTLWLNSSVHPGWPLEIWEKLFGVGINVQC